MPQSNGYYLSDPDLIFLVAILIFVILYRKSIDGMPISTVAIFFLILCLGKRVIDIWNSDNLEGMAIISNEAIQDLSSAFNGDTMTVTKQYCITGSKCIDKTVMDKIGVPAT